MPRIKPSFPLGSLSTGSLLTDDLASAASDALWTLYQYGYALLKEVAPLMKALEDIEASAERDECDPSEILSDVEQFIDDHCPPYVRYGALEGDGADIGFWPCITSLNEDREGGEIVDLSYRRGVSQNVLPKLYTGLAVYVSDHGNVELYQYARGRQVRSIWSCV